MPILKAFLFGPLDICYDEQPLPTPPTLKSQSLLAYLLLHRQRPQPREQLANLFWGDRPERKARRSLATALWHIRRCFPGEQPILGDPLTIQFDPRLDLWLDVTAFESAASTNDISGMETAATLYRGQFLDGFYDDWIIGERYRLENLYLEVLAQLMVCQESNNNFDRALATATRLLNHDPLREDAHRVAMRAYIRLGQRNSAIEQYHRCRELAQEHLAVDPMVETTELYQMILGNRFITEQGTQIASRQTVEVVLPVARGRNPLDALVPSRLVGREKELAFLNDTWQLARAGQGKLILIVGEAGIGKSRLVEDFASNLLWRGNRVLWGHCHEFESILPYQPIAEALRTVLTPLMPADLLKLPTWVLRGLCRLVPELTEKLDSMNSDQHPTVNLVPALRTDQDRAHFFDGLVRFFDILSSRDATLIVLEDLHWATESTLQLVYHLSRRLANRPIAILGTFRPEEVDHHSPLQAFLQQLQAKQLDELLHLPRLSAADVDTVIAEMSGARKDAIPLAQRLFHETEGNPFFLIEIVKNLFEIGAIALKDGIWDGDFELLSTTQIALPAGVSETISARLRHLDYCSQDALETAAVLGNEFDFDLLDRVWNQGEEATLEALDKLLRHRLIEETTNPQARDYAFTHNKIQQTIYTGIKQRRRQRTHARAGEAMEGLYHNQKHAVVGELAFHFEQALQLNDTSKTKAVHYLLEAGDQARELHAFREALDYYRRALIILKELGEPDQVARTLMKMGLIYHSTFDFRLARKMYQEGFAFWQQAGNDQSSESLPPAPHALRTDWRDPMTLDPTIAQDWHSSLLTDQLFSGLVELSPDMEIIPDVALGWEISDGGRKYTFSLRDDVYWSDGMPVVAGDFEYAWKRALDPASGAYAATLLYDIEGAEAFHQGKGQRSHVGVRAYDDSTLTVELTEPTAYFLQLLAFNVTYPVPQHVAEENATWSEPSSIVTNGPFMLATWNRGEAIVLQRNPTYHGRFLGNLQRVELDLTQGSASGLVSYKADQADVFELAGSPPLDLERTRQQYAGELVSIPWLRTTYAAFSTNIEPFDDIRVRQAFALATDRETLADIVLQGFHFPALGGFVPPGIPGHSAEIGLLYDPERAQQLMAEAGYPGGHGFPTVEALFGQGRVRLNELVEYLLAQWKENLGIEFHLKELNWNLFLDRLDDPPPLHFVGWSADYPDPDNFLRACPMPHWSSSEKTQYDQLVERARHLPDREERMTIYQQADKILVEEAAIIPLVYRQTHLLVKPWVRKYPTSVSGWRFWKHVIIEPH